MYSACDAGGFRNEACGVCPRVLLARSTLTAVQESLGLQPQCQMERLGHLPAPVCLGSVSVGRRFPQLGSPEKLSTTVFLREALVFCVENAQNRSMQGWLAIARAVAEPELVVFDKMMDACRAVFAQCSRCGQ